MKTEYPKPPEITLALVSNVWCRQMHFLREGDVELGHSHYFDHLSLVASGSVRVWIEKEYTDFVAPAMVFIAKAMFHRLEALEDNTVVHCIHALRTGEKIEDIISPEMIPNGSTAKSIITEGIAMPLVDAIYTQYKK